MTKEDKKPDEGLESSKVLTEWQKRHLEFEQRKKEREAEKAKQEEEERARKRAAFKARASKEEKADQEETDQELEVPQDEPVVEEVLAEEEETREEEVGEGEEQSWSEDELEVWETVENSQPPALEQPTPKLPRQRKSLLSPSFKRALPILLSSLLVLLLSVFMISPFSKDKVLVVKGNQQTTAEEVLTASAIKDTDYISQVFLEHTSYEANIVKEDLWVKSARIHYQFPNRFEIRVQEHTIVAYQETDEGFYPVLETGERADLAHQFPEQFLTVKLDDPKDVASFAKQLSKVDASIRQSIQSVTLAGSSATEDLLLLTMADGHQVRVPLSEVAKKLPYYKQISPNLLEPSIVDMEVGIYTTTDALETLASQTKASKVQESKEVEAWMKANGMLSSTSTLGQSGLSRTRTEMSEAAVTETSDSGE